jgi:arsenate reductase (glutaredoxin)
MLAPMDTFAVIVTVGMVLLFLWILALGLWHPRSGADVLQWKPTRSADVEVQNDVDDVAQMIAAQNALRERHGKARRTQDQVEDQVRAHQREMADYADAYWSDRREARTAGGDDAGMGLVVYEKPTCSNCRRLARILGERGIDFERVDFHVEGLPAERIRELLAKAGVSARQALREKEPGAAALLDASEEAILAAMEADPALLQRPIVERGDRAVLARPVERVLELL